MSENLNITTVPSINDTVVTAVNDNGYGGSGYETIVEAVVKALQEREHGIAEQIIESADNRYGYGSQAKEVVVDAGLYLKPEAPVEEAPAAETGDGSAVEERLTKLESSIDTLLGLARRHFGDNL